jgi:acetolactate synthase I/II/III large subunit
MIVADLIVTRLRDAGVRTLFGVPGGGSNLDLIAAAGRAGLRFVLTSTETAGALAAMAQAEITGCPGACLTTLGPGAASVVNGVAAAFLDRAPLIVFTDSHSSEARAFEHQRLDHAALLGSITKRSVTLRAGSAAAAIDRAIELAMAPPRGPVHLDCPGDVAGATMTEYESTAAPPAPPPEPGVDGAVAALVQRSQKPLLLVGLGARQREDAIAIRRLCESRRIPAMVTYKAKGVVPDDHPWFGGVFTNASIEQPLLNQSDLLIGIGLDPVELIPRRWKHGQPVVYCGRWTVDTGQVPFAAQLIARVADGVRQIDDGMTESAWDEDDLRRLLGAQRRRICVRADGLTAQRVVDIAAGRLAGLRVTVDAGAHMFPATMMWPVSEVNEMLISNGLSTMGFALPAAIGAALVDPGKPVVALTGDGGLLMCVGELLTAVREKLSVITIVFSDASLSLIDIKQQARRHERSGVDLGVIAWPAVAGGFGVAAFCAQTEDQLDACISRALACQGPVLIEAKIDPGNYGETLRAVRG